MTSGHHIRADVFNVQGRIVDRARFPVRQVPETLGWELTAPEPVLTDPELHAWRDRHQCAAWDKVDELAAELAELKRKDDAAIAKLAREPKAARDDHQREREALMRSRRAYRDDRDAALIDLEQALAKLATYEALPKVALAMATEPRCPTCSDRGVVGALGRSFIAPCPGCSRPVTR